MRRSSVSALRVSLPVKVSIGWAGCLRTGMNVAKSAITLSTFKPVMNVIKSSQCEPISDMARMGPPNSGSSRQFQSVG